MNMLKKRFILLIIVSLVYCSCTKEDEVPPMTVNFDSEFILPSPKPLTYDERAYVDQRRDEHNKAVGNNY
jgi:hypothetical protein